MSEWKPQPGELVEMHNGKWKILRKSQVTGDVYIPGYRTCEVEGNCKPLLPAVSSADEQLLYISMMEGAVSNIEGHKKDGLVILKLETCQLSFFRVGNYPVRCIYDFIDNEPDDPEDTQLEFEARGRDYQKEGAIREWPKQVPHE